ncbi:hypothetical protein PanWU01x14_019010, partial [Parasponia andersonii]
LANNLRADRATGKATETLANMAEAVDLEEDDANNEVQEESYNSSISMNQTSASSHFEASKKKRARSASDIATRLEN